MYTDKELAQLISEVETEFSSYLAKAEDVSLAKSEDDSKPADKDEKKPEAKKEDSEEKPAAPEKKDDKAEEATAAPAQDAAAEEAQAEEAEVPTDVAPPAQAEEGTGYDEEDMAHMDAMYSSMSRPELIAHHDAVKRALDAMGIQDQDAQMAPAAPAADAQPPMDMQKSETVEVAPEVLVQTAETELLKSELTAKTAEVTELKKSVEVMTTFIEKILTKKSAPQGKAITSLEVIKKNEDGNSAEQDFSTLTKGEITARLNKKASDNKLEKADREAINKFYESGAVNINGISHLLK